MLAFFIEHSITKGIRFSPRAGGGFLSFVQNLFKSSEPVFKVHFNFLPYNGFQLRKGAMPIFMKKKAKTRGRILRRIIVAILVLALLAGGVWIACRALKQEYSVTYQGYTATTGSISNTLSFSGNLSLVSSESYSASSASTVRTVYVSAGDEVNEGDKLVRLANGQTVEAGLDGRVNAVSVAEGDPVAAGAALVQVADFTHLKVQLRVDEYDVGSVHVGDACTVTATATEKTFESEIAAIDYISASGGSVAYYTATAYVDVDDGVYPGMQVTVSIPQEQAENVVILKEAALSFDADNSAYVWMYNDAGELERVDVEVGVSNGNYVEIVSGLSDGDEVYVEVEQEASSSGGLLAGLFGSQQMNAPGGGDFGGGGMPGGGDFDFSGMPSDFSGGGMSGGRPMGGGQG